MAYVCALAYVEPGGREEVVARAAARARSRTSRAATEASATTRRSCPTTTTTTRTMAELTPAEKDAISHRGRAARALLERLAEDDRHGVRGPLTRLSRRRREARGDARAADADDQRRRKRTRAVANGHTALSVTPAELADARVKQRTALMSVVAASCWSALKLATGLLTGSLAFVAEAAHSATDLVAALLTLFAVRVAVRPPDEEHHYGHGKAEHLAALGESAFLVAGVAVHRLRVAAAPDWGCPRGTGGGVVGLHRVGAGNRPRCLTGVIEPPGRAALRVARAGG